MTSSATSASMTAVSDVASSSSSLAGVSTTAAAQNANTNTVNASSAPNSSSSAVKRTVVTAKRKEELLVQARSERRRWIQGVPLPYDSKQLAKVCGGVSNNRPQTAVQQLWSLRDGLEKFQSSLICGKRFLPGATSVISELYGMGGAIDDSDDEKADEMATSHETQDYPLNLDEVKNRVERLAKPFWTSKEVDSQDRSVAIDGSNVELPIKNAKVDQLSEEGNAGGTLDDQKYEDLYMAYEEFSEDLMLPESAVTVQGMKNFVRQFASSAATCDNDQKIRNLATTVNGQARSSYTALAARTTSNNSNKKTTSVGGDAAQPGLDRRSLESFLYGQVEQHVYDALDRVLAESSSSPFSMTQSAFESRLEELQFLQPSHLEIACLVDDTSSTTLNLDTVLNEPIKALQSIGAFYSPYEKLCRVLQVFRGVNAGLSSISKVVPSADDVLPTVILVVVKAASFKKQNCGLKNFLRDLYFIESFALPEYLRGEAGYAFTNLYGAVQFLQELELDDNDNSEIGSKNNRLSISPSELRKELERSRNEAASNYAKRNGILDATEQKGNGLISKGVAELLNDSTNVFPSNFLPTPKILSVQAVRSARLAGKTPDLEWALRQCSPQSNGDDFPQARLSYDETKTLSSSTPTKSPSPLPQHRYTFFGVRPESVRVSDLPKLLEEYRRLVLTTEDLLGEQQRANQKVQAEKKRHREEKHRKTLGEQALLL